MRSADLFAPITQPPLVYLAEWLPGGAGSWPAHVLVGLAHWVEVALWLGVLAAGGLFLQRATAWPRAVPRDRYAAHAVLAAAAAAALGLLAWIVRHPSSEVYALVDRFDHLAFCVLAGCVLGWLPAAVRKWGLIVLSLLLLASHVGWGPLRAAALTGVLGFAVLRLPGLESPRATTVGQAMVLGGAFLYGWHLRPQHMLLALQTQGLYAFVLLRQISFAVEARRGYPADLGNYLCYMLFYPPFFGASEIYSEFYDRNLRAPVAPNYRRATILILRGQVEMWLALLIPVSSDQVLSTQGTLTLWAIVLAVFVRSALFIMGLWAGIEGVAWLYGMELRPNFAGILRCENPSQFWRAWRATMTNWLIHYVYIPLGGNRRKQSRNILAAFAVTMAWHWMGIPFFSLQLRPLDFVPPAAWAALNSVAVVVYAIGRKRQWRLLPEDTPRIVRQGAKIFLTACLGTFTVTLLGFRPDTIARFVPFLRTVLGLNF